MTERRAEWSAKGGTGRSNENRARKAIAGDLRDLSTVQATMLRVLKKLEKNEIDVPVANAMANVSRALEAVAKANANVVLEQQVAELAKQIAEFTGKQSA